MQAPLRPEATFTPTLHASPGGRARGPLRREPTLLTGTALSFLDNPQHAPPSCSWFKLPPSPWFSQCPLSKQNPSRSVLGSPRPPSHPGVQRGSQVQACSRGWPQCGLGSPDSTLILERTTPKAVFGSHRAQHTAPDVSRGIPTTTSSGARDSVKTVSAFTLRTARGKGPPVPGHGWEVAGARPPRRPAPRRAQGRREHKNGHEARRSPQPWGCPEQGRAQHTALCRSPHLPPSH